MTIILKSIKSIWTSTTGEMFREGCEIITEDEGETFFCKTHNKECEFDEGFFCPEGK